MALTAAVQPFTPAYAAARADVPADQIIEAARTFAKARHGSATGGTGANMSLHGTLVEYLMQCLNTVCGRYVRGDERISNPLTFVQSDFKAQCLPKIPAWKFGHKLRTRRLEETIVGMPTGALADEILTPGKGQIKALLSVCSNAVVAWPDQAKTLAAFKALELSVAIDIRMSATARVSDYVIASKLSYETPGTTKSTEILGHTNGVGWERPYAMYTPKLVDPPKGSDAIDMWEFYYGIAQRLRLEINVAGVPIDMERKLSTDELLDLLGNSGRIKLEEIKTYPHGRIFDNVVLLAKPRDPECEERLDVGVPMMMGELAQVLVEGRISRDPRFSYQLISRRTRNVFNSTGQQIRRLNKKGYNPAYMSPKDMSREALRPGDLIEIRSNLAAILGVVEEAEDVREGIISMTHAFGDVALDDHDVTTIGSPTARLINTDIDYDPMTGIPRMSAVPVRVKRVEQ